MNVWIKNGLAYGVIAVAGAFASTAFCVPIMRSWRAGREIDSAGRLIHANRLQDAAAILERIKPWSSVYPVVETTRICAHIRSLVRAGMVREAESLARELFEESAADSSQAPRSFSQSIQRPMNALINTIMSQSAGTMYEGRLSGYEALAEELSLRGDVENLDRAVKILLSLDSDNQTGLRLSDQVERLARRKAAPREQPPSDTKPKEQAPRVDHVELARKHLMARDWDRAMEECDAAAKTDPDNPRIEQIRKLARARGRKWGVVTSHSAKIFDQSGKQVGKLEAGSLVTVEGTKSTSIGTVLVIRPQASPADAEPVLVPIKYVDVRSGLLTDASDREVELRVKKAKIQADLDMLRSEYTREQNRRNPYAAEYEAAAAAYKAFVKKLNDLQAQAEKAVGPERIRLMEERKAMIMKGEDKPLIKALDEAKKKMEEWQKNNPSPPPEGSDSRIAEMETALAQVQKEIESLEYHP